MPTLRPIAPCVVSHNLALGGAQTAVLRLIKAMPDWVREKITLYVQSQDMPLLDAAMRKHHFEVGAVTTTPPSDPSSWLLSYGNLKGLPQRPTSLVLHSWDDEGWRYNTKTYAEMTGLTVAAVSKKVHARYRRWIKQAGHEFAGILPPPVTEMCIAKASLPRGRSGNGTAHLVVGWMGRPIESKGIMSLPWLLKMDDRIVLRVWTGADTSALAYTRKAQGQVMDRMLALAHELGVADRLDLRPLDFDPFAYRHRLEGCHVLLGNSRAEGFLLTAAEALSCGIPVVVTTACGITDYIREGVNGCTIDWSDDPKALAADSLKAIRKAAKLKPADCVRSVESLTLQGLYRQVHGNVLARLTHTELQHDDARVTIGVRIHKNTDVTHLDDAIASIANQTYRQFKTVLLVDGPWSFGEQLAARFGLPLICTGQEPDITHCSWLHRQAVEQCDTELYKPLDYDDQLTPDYLARAVAMLDRHKADVYGCLLLTLQNGTIAPRLHWPSRPVETMFTGNSDHNQLPHSSVLMKVEAARRAGNYQERAVGLGADDYHLWYRLWRTGAVFFRDDEARNVVYRIHEKNSLPVRKARYGQGVASASAGKAAAKAAIIAGAAAASFVIAPMAMGQSASDATLGGAKGKQKMVSKESVQPGGGDEVTPPAS
jgi:glycosyltransferase involved in cell wall biosynthesis